MRDLLTDGPSAVVRPVRPEDEAASRAFFLGLSPRTLRLRFHHAEGAVNDALVRFYTQVDQDRHLAFVAEADGRIVGDARCIAHPGNGSCELGIVVADDWHHTGLAQRLMQALEAAARARGYRRIEGLVLAENKDMLDFVRSLGFETQDAPQEPATVRVVKRL
jgi:acetyltransferase